MQPYALKDKFNRLELINTYCGYVLDETDKIKQITQSITHKSLYANAISTARTRALPNAVTADNIIEVMHEIYNDLRTQRKLPGKTKGNEVSLATTAAGGASKSCWICGKSGHLKATCPEAKKSRSSSTGSSGYSGKSGGYGGRGGASGRGGGGARSGAGGGRGDGGERTSRQKANQQNKVCNHCGKKGHLEAQCWTKQRQQKGREVATAVTATHKQPEFIVASVELDEQSQQSNSEETNATTDELALLIAVARSDPFQTLTCAEKRHDEWMPHCSVVMGEIEKVMASKQPACTFCILQDKECLRHAPIKKLKDLVMKYHENQEGNYSAEMTARMNDCEFCKSSFRDVCCRCRFN
jgi:hypothetical protein